MLKIQRAANGEIVFKLVGRMDVEHVAELQKLLKSEDHNRPILMDLADLTLVNGDGVRFLDHCETDGIKLKNCPAYIREWITRQRQGS
jgi:anti-anti-sigma regulatory factor